MCRFGLTLAFASIIKNGATFFVPSELDIFSNACLKLSFSFSKVRWWWAVDLHFVETFKVCPSN